MYIDIESEKYDMAINPQEAKELTEIQKKKVNEVEMDFDRRLKEGERNLNHDYLDDVKVRSKIIEIYKSVDWIVEESETTDSYFGSFPLLKFKEIEHKSKKHDWTPW